MAGGNALRYDSGHWCGCGYRGVSVDIGVSMLRLGRHHLAFYHGVGASSWWSVVVWERCEGRSSGGASRASKQTEAQRLVSQLCDLLGNLCTQPDCRQGN